MIHIKNLSKKYEVQLKEEGFLGSVRGLFHRRKKQVPAVKDISFTIEQGEMVGFIGQNGAGKTTTLKMLSGLLYPTAGKLDVLGFTPFDRKAEYLKQISLVMGQKNQLWWDLPAIETFRLNRDIYEIDERIYKKTLDELVELFEVEDILNQQVRQLSLGQRMKCEFIAALLHSPKILFLDEPTIGLDIIIQKRIREFIKAYNKKCNSTVILTSHYMDDVREVCDRIIMIDQGTIIFDGPVNTLIKTYANYKILVPIFNKQVTKTQLKGYGTLQSLEYPKAVITVPRDKVSIIAAKLLHDFDLDDLDINEPNLEDVVRDVFERKKVEK